MFPNSPWTDTYTQINMHTNFPDRAISRNQACTVSWCTLGLTMMLTQLNFTSLICSYRCDDAYNITMVTRKLVFHNVHMLYANISTIQQLLHMYNACCSYIAIVGRLTFSNTFAVKLHKSKVVWTKDIASYHSNP